MASGRSDCAVASRLERGVPWSTAVSVASMAGRSTSMHGWHTSTCRWMVGSPPMCPFFFFFSCWRRGRELEEYDCVCTDKYRKQTGRQGELYQYGRRLLVPESQNPKMAIAIAWPRLPLGFSSWFRSQSTDGPPHLTHQSPLTCGPFLFAGLSPPVILRHGPSSYLLTAQCSHLNQSLIFLTPHDEATGRRAARGHSHPRQHLSRHLSLSLFLLLLSVGSRSCLPPMSPSRHLATRPLTRPSGPRGTCSSSPGPAARLPRRQRREEMATWYSCAVYHVMCARQHARAIFPMSPT